MSVLMTHHFLFTAEVVTPLELDDHSGSALRVCCLTRCGGASAPTKPPQAVPSVRCTRFAQ